MNFFQYSNSQIDSFTICLSIDHCLNHLAYDENADLAVGGSRQHILNTRQYSMSNLFCFSRDENIASYPSVLLMRKDFAFRSRIDYMIQNAFEGGLFVKWNRDSQRKMKRKFYLDTKPELTLKEYGILFSIFALGWSLSILVFICEYFIQNKLKETNTSEIWRFLDRFIDAKRYYFKNLPEKMEQMIAKKRENRAKRNQRTKK